MIRVYLTNYYNAENDVPASADLSTQYSFYGYNTNLVRSDIEITDIVLSLDIENIDFYVRKEPSKARLELLMNESIYGYNYTRTRESIIEDFEHTTKKVLSAMEKNDQLGFNDDTFRLGSIVTILDDSQDINGNEQNTSETFSGTVQSGKRNADGSFSFTDTNQVSNQTNTTIMSNSMILDNSMKLFVGRITEMNNDHEKIGITVENCIYEFRNMYRELYSTLAQYKSYDAKKDKEQTGLRATAGDIINVCRAMITNLRPIETHRNSKDTNLIYDSKYDFYVPLSAISNKSLMEIMQWALQQYWSNFVVKNKLAIQRSNSLYYDDIFEITADQETEFTEKLVYSYPVVRFNYNVTRPNGTPVPIESMYISTFYEVNTQDIKSDIKVGLYNVTVLNPDNIVSYKFNRSTKNIVNDLFIMGINKDDKKNVTVIDTLQYPNEKADKTSELLWNSQIKYGKHRLFRTIDLVDNTISLETFAKDIGSLLAEPDYGFTVNIINYNGIQLNDAVLVNLTNTNKKVYEVKNIVYKYVGGRSEATLDLKPVLIAIDDNQKSKPSTIHNTGR